MHRRLSRTTQTAPTPAITRRAGGGGGSGLADLHELQRHAGNRLLGSFIQREDTGGQSAGGEGEGAQQDWAADRRNMEDVRADTQVRALKLDAFVGKALGDIQSITQSLELVSKQYDECYEHYAKAVEQARLDTKKNQQWADIGISVAIGLALVAAPELSIFELVGAEGVVSEEVGAKLTEVGMHTVAETGAVKSGVLELAGGELKTGGMTPEGQELATTKNLVAMYKKVLEVGGQTSMLTLIASGAEYAIGEIKAQIGGGAGADMKVPELVELMDTLGTADVGTASLDQRIEEATKYFTDLQQRALMTEVDPRKMEQDIAIMAMAEMSDDEAPELKAIKGYLDDIGVISAGHWSGDGGRLNVDFGWIYASSGDTRKAVAAAKAERDKLKSEYDALAGGGGGGGE